VWHLVPADARGSDGPLLQRRGVVHGRIVPADDGAGEAADEPGLEEAWARAEPIFLPGILSAALPPLRAAIADALALFDHLREGGRFLDAVLALLEGRPEFRPEGSTVDRLEAREIEKVFVSGVVDGKRVRAGRDVWAKLAWVAHDERDLSLRIRFSCGTEQLHDWHRDVEAQQWADRFAEALFPECAALAANPELRDLLARLLGAQPRLSERIVFSFAPGGGVVFHHDADPTQRGVVYGQLVGSTAWLALPYRELVRHVVEHAGERGERADPAEVGARLHTEDPVLGALLNEDPAFTRRLANAGWLVVLEAGDALVLPSHDAERVAWHSVFAVGAEPSLAHSHGLFAG